MSEDEATLARRVRDLEAKLAEQAKAKPAQSLLTQSFLTSLPIVLTIGLGFLVNQVQSERQHRQQLDEMRAATGKQRVVEAAAEQRRKEEASRQFELQERDASAKLTQQNLEFEANAAMAEGRFAQEQSTLRSQHRAQQAQQAREFEQSLERQRRQNETDLVLQVIKVGDLDLAKSNIDFLLSAGLVRDPDGKIRAAAKTQTPVLPTASGAIGEIRVPGAGTAEGQKLVSSLISGGADSKASGPLGKLIDVISRERDRYSVRELAIMLAVIEFETGGRFVPTEAGCTRDFVVRLRRLSEAQVPEVLSREACFELMDGPGSRFAKALGNTEPGDGYRYRGRGYNSVTGRANYARVSRAWSTDYVARPELLQEPIHAFRAMLTLGEPVLAEVRKLAGFADADTAQFDFAAAANRFTRGFGPQIGKRAAAIETVLKASSR